MPFRKVVLRPKRFDAVPGAGAVARDFYTALEQSDILCGKDDGFLIRRASQEPNRYGRKSTGKR